MKIVVETANGDVYESMDSPIEPMNRAAAKIALLQTVASNRQITLETEDGFIIVPAPVVQQSVVRVTGFNDECTDSFPLPRDVMMSLADARRSDADILSDVRHELAKEGDL